MSKLIDTSDKYIFISGGSVWVKKLGYVVVEGFK
jgi:hypothetical protein